MQFMTIFCKPLPDYKSKERTDSPLKSCCLVWVLKSRSPINPSLNKHFFLQRKLILTRAILKKHQNSGNSFRRLIYSILSALKRNTYLVAKDLWKWNISSQFLKSKLGKFWFPANIKYSFQYLCFLSIFADFLSQLPENLECISLHVKMCL